MQNQEPYNNFQPPLPQKTKHKVLLIVAAIVATLVVVIGVAFLLKHLAITKTDSSTQAVTLTPAQIIEAFVKPDAIKALSPDAYDPQPVNTNAGVVIFKPESAIFTIDTPTKDTGLYAAKNPKTPDDVNIVQEQVQAFMAERGYKKGNNTASATSKNPSFVTFENNIAVCQLSSAQSAENSTLPSYHKLSCVSKEIIAKEYEAINALLDIYQKDHQPISTTEAIRTVISEGNKSLATLNLLNDNKQTSLLFAAIDNSWEYIGNLSEGDASNAGGKYAISPQVQQAMANPKYGDFLTKNILGR